MTAVRPLPHMMSPPGPLSAVHAPAHEQQTDLGTRRASQAASRDEATRVVLLDKATFAWLRRLQEGAPAPRLEMRYYVEGLLRLLQASRPLQARWLAASRRALIEHAELQELDAAAAALPDLSSVESLDEATRPTPLQEAGTGLANGHAEGAAPAGTARTSGLPRTPQPPQATRNADCRALHVGDGAFQWLKGVQDTTHDPRIDFRFLLQGAFALVRSDLTLIADVISAARGALMEHLVRLNQQPIALNPSEIAL